ncbi:MFS general substrate transporter [Xylariaceae sp. FL0662B]|nr:MFS general substrate transporter [Xylariaceae sp. FL0662B]
MTVFLEPEPDSVTSTGTSTPTVLKEADVLNQETRITAPPPDGGLVAWVQVIGSWCVIFCTFGIVNSFGVYQTYYEQNLSGTSSSDISWVGSIQGCLLLCGGLVSGPLFDAGYFRYLLCTGLLFIVLGQFMTSLCTQFWQIVLAQGLCIGVGCGIVFLPCTAIISQYFTTRRALATGISSMGSPVAGIVLPVVFSELHPRVGAPWATRVIAFILLGISIVPLVFLRSRVAPSAHHRALIDTSALRDIPFTTFTISCLFAFMALYIPFFYIELFTIDYDLAPQGFPSSYMVMLMNAGSVIGRVIPPYIADKTRQPTLVMALSAFMCCILAFGWLRIRNFPGILVFTILYGIISGGVVSMQAAGTFSLTHDMSKVGTRLGMNCFVCGIALLVGNPIAGVILGDASEARWRGVIGFTADLLLVGSGILAVTIWFVLRGKKA